MTFLDSLNLPKFDFTQNQSNGKIIKHQQSKALTSHFESFWIIHSAFYCHKLYEKLNINFTYFRDHSTYGLDRHQNRQRLNFIQKNLSKHPSPSIFITINVNYYYIPTIR